VVTLTGIQYYQLLSDGLQVFKDSINYVSHIFTPVWTLQAELRSLIIFTFPTWK